MKLFFRNLLKSLTSHIFLKVVSLVLAVILWSYIITVTPSLTRTKHVSDLSASLSGESALSNYGLSVSTDVYMEYLHQISASVDVSQSQYSKVNNKNVIVTADVSNIRSAGQHEVQLKASSVYGEVTHIYPETISLTVENLDRREMPIDVTLTGMSADQYWYRVVSDSINPQQVTLSGPVSLIQNVVSVGASIDVSGVTDSFRRGVTLSMLDISGNPIVSRRVTKSATTCSVRVEVYPKKEYDVFVDASQIRVADGYQIDNIRFQPSAITVAAERELLESLEHLPLEIPENMPELSQSYTTRLSFSGLNEFKYISSKQVYMTVTVSEVRDTVTLTDVPVNVYGLNTDLYTASVSPSLFSVQLSVPRSQLSEIDSADFSAYVDVTGLEKGNFDLPITIGSNPDISIVSIVPTSIKVEISEIDNARAEEKNDLE